MKKVYPIFGWASGNTSVWKYVYERMLLCSPKNDGVWKDIKIIDNKNDADFFVIFSNGNLKNIDPKKSIVFETEPHFIRKKNKKWFNINRDMFLNYCGIKEMHVVLPNWYIGCTYEELKKSPHKTKVLSSIMSNKRFSEYQRRRIEFCSMLNRLPFFDCYGRNKINGIKHRGKLVTKKEGLFPYKYSFHCENCRETNYFTEKITDCFLSETLCFYDGCPNIFDFFSTQSLIRVNMDDLEGSLNIIKKSIENNEWEKRLRFIRKEKMKIMEDMNPLQIIHNILSAS